MAEVLITLGIIGVVAALTMPSLVAHYKKIVIETKLRKFYSIMQEAVKLSEIENGDKKEWAVNGDIEKYYNKYYSKYLNGARFNKIENLSGTIYFSDGTALNLNANSSDIIYGGFYISTKDIGKKNLKSGKDSFLFMWAPNITSRAQYCESPFLNNYDKGWEPYSYWENRYWDNTKKCAQIVVPDNSDEFNNILINSATYGCATGGQYCTELIRRNGWKIPDNYPIKL